MSRPRHNRHAADTPPPGGVPTGAHLPVPAADLRFPFGGLNLAPEEVVRILEGFLSEARRERIEKVLAGRTYALTPVLEGVVDTGNVSAVIRTAEALGCQALHLITAGRTFKNSDRTAGGAQEWMDLYRWDRSADCARFLKEGGFRIVATTLSEARPLHDVSFAEPTAVVFGNERDGLSPELLAAADERCMIPMLGFTTSFNVSVAAALVLHHARQDRLRRTGAAGDLKPEERANLRAQWYLQSVRHARGIIERDLHRR